MNGGIGMTINGTTSICLFPNDAAKSQETRTVIVFGMTRGGTSMVAGVVRAFGVFMGADLLVNQEDADFCYKTDEYMLQAIAQRNAAHGLWGFKYPLAADFVERLLPAMRNPMFIIVARDVVATAGNLIRWDDREPSGAIVEGAMQTLKNINLAIRLRVPTLYVSYEKVAQNSEAFLSETEQFIGLPLIADRARLRRFMEPGSYKSYEEVMLESRIPV